MLYQCFCANTARPHCHTCLTQTASLRRHRRSTDSHSREPDVEQVQSSPSVLDHRLPDWKFKESWTSMWTKRHGNNQHHVSCSDEVLDLLVKTSLRFQLLLKTGHVPSVSNQLEFCNTVYRDDPRIVWYIWKSSATTSVQEVVRLWRHPNLIGECIMEGIFGPNYRHPSHIHFISIFVKNQPINL